MDSLRDPELQSDAKKSNLEIEPIDGPTMGNAIAGLYDIESATVGKLKEILTVKN